jgi:O-antigen/teichoic acid export membrane protein
MIKNVLTSWGAVGLVMVSFLFGHLGTQGYGAIRVLMSVIGFVGIADLGLRAALSRELSEKVALKDEDGFRCLSSLALILNIGPSSPDSGPFCSRK